MPRSTLRLGLAAGLSVAVLGGVVAASPVAATSPEPTSPPSDATVTTTFSSYCTFGTSFGTAQVTIDPRNVPGIQLRGFPMPERPVPLEVTLRFPANVFDSIFDPVRAAGGTTLVDASDPAGSQQRNRTSVAFAYLGKSAQPATWPTRFDESAVPSAGTVIPPAGAPYGEVVLPATATIAPTSYSALGHGVWTFSALDLSLGLTTGDGTRVAWPAYLSSNPDPEVLDVNCTPFGPGPEFRRMYLETLNAPWDTGVLTPTAKPSYPPTPQPTPTGLDPNLRTPTAVPTSTPPVTTTPTPTAGPEPTPTATAEPEPTPTVTPLPTPTSDPIGLSARFDVSGSATLKNLTKGTVPVRGSLQAYTTDFMQRQLRGDLAFTQTSANLLALGFLPVSATVDLLPLTSLTGQLTNGGLSAKTSVRIKLPKVSVLGIPLGGGKDCQTKNPSQLNLASVGGFEWRTGGTLSGTFSISNLAGCGFLNELISPLTAGSSNAISLKLTPSE